MRLSWNEIRVRAAQFCQEWQAAQYEKGETQSFYNDFFNVFGVQRRKVASYETHVEKLNNKTGFIDLFWPGTLLVEQKSAGGNLTKAREQAYDYCDSLSDKEFPRYILVSDFQNFSLYDLEADRPTNNELHFKLADLPRHVERFGFITGVQSREFKDQDPVNIRASELMATLHDKLADIGYGGHDLEQLLVRLVFCLFADNTGIFERDSFLGFLSERTQEDGSDLGARLVQFFQTLNTPLDVRQETLDEDLAQFPYVNGDLFRDTLRIPAFDSGLRASLITACHFDWGKVSPAIFGALFQGVMDPQQRRQQGAHYTGEQNILKVIEPLFMDELRAEFDRIKSRKTERKKHLRAFHEKLAGLTFFDPACGCGNFLVIAYRELRKLEIELLRALYPTGQRELDVAQLLRIDVHQFYGIELEEFPTRIAETALWMMDHIMNNELSLTFGQSFLRIPLQKSPHIQNQDALEMDWQKLLPPAQASYIFGNPPFGGAKFQTPEQREQVRRIANLGGAGGTLDFVTAWFIKAAAYVQSSDTQIGFVATNSIVQGEQVAQFWPLLFDRYKLEISFAHRSFAWSSEARGKAAVFCVILGLARADNTPTEKRLFSYTDDKGTPEESRHAKLSPYLFDAAKLTNPHLVVKEEARPINGLQQMVIGSKPIDGGQYIFTEAEKSTFLKTEPKAEKYLRPFIGAKEYLHGDTRYILALHRAAPQDLRAMPEVKKRIEAVRAYRKASKSSPTQKLAETPTLYHVNVVPEASFLVVPKVSTKRRDYIPIGWLEPPTIPSDLLFVICNAELDLFGVLTSAMHMAWIRTVTGRLGTGYRYSVGVVYNSFPMPNMTDRQRAAIGTKARAILNARTKHQGATLADLYDPDTMPPDLRHAHTSLDTAVDRLYRKDGFASERERVEHLFGLYETLTAPLTAAKPRRKGWK